MSKKALALDIGGTKIYNTIIDEDGNILAEVEKHSTPKTIKEFETLLKNIFSKYENDVDIIAVATAGAVNNENNKVISSTANLPKGYNQIDFQSFTLTKKVFVENDANAAAWAEHVLGASKNCPYSVILTLGTGVGGGIILNNKLYKGKSGGAGEMHFKMYSDKRRKCTCGAWDCFEAYASGTGLKITAEEILAKEVTTYDVIQGMKSGNEEMKAVFDTWQDHILNGLVGLANLFDPDCFILSGSMSEFVDTDYLEKGVNEQIVTAPTKIYKATTGNYAGMLGAALLALEKGNRQ